MDDTNNKIKLKLNSNYDLVHSLCLRALVAKISRVLVARKIKKL